MEVFSKEDAQNRILINFPIEQLFMDEAKDIASGKLRVVFNKPEAKYYLKLFNARHGESLPQDFQIEINAVKYDWREGHGLDMETYTDSACANWTHRTRSQEWTTPGGDIITEEDNYPLETIIANFPKGTEDLCVDITEYVRSWCKALETGGMIGNQNHGLLLSIASNDGEEYLYTKRFFARGTQHFFKRPHIEMQYDSAIEDDRSAFYSTTVDGNEIPNTLYFFNNVRGKFVDVKADSLHVRLYNAKGEELPNSPPDGYMAFSLHDGIWQVPDIVISTKEEIIYDKWWDAAQTKCFHEGTIRVRQPSTIDVINNQYLSNITNLKPSYTPTEQARLRVFVRKKNWSPTIHSVSRAAVDEPEVIREGYFQVYRILDRQLVVEKSSGTRMSYDSQGNYFDFDVSMLEPGYAYSFQFLFKEDDILQTQPDLFRFRVDK